MEDLPKIIDIRIDKELIARSGEFYDNAKCPVSTFLTQVFLNQLAGDMSVISSLNLIHVYLKTGLHRYSITPSFLQGDYDKVMDTGIPYITTAVLQY
jgi:hypothetical protein